VMNSLISYIATQGCDTIMYYLVKVTLKLKVISEALQIFSAPLLV
jgi:hypothetical protein